MSLWTINFAKISIYLEIHRQASLPMRIFIRRKQITVKIDCRSLRQARFLTNCCLSHKQDDRFLAGHGQYVGMKVVNRCCPNKLNPRKSYRFTGI